MHIFLFLDVLTLIVCFHEISAFLPKNPMTLNPIMNNIIKLKVLDEK